MLVLGGGTGLPTADGVMLPEGVGADDVADVDVSGCWATGVVAGATGFG